MAEREALMARAAAVDAKVLAGEPLRPLEGLPMVVKVGSIYILDYNISSLG